MEDEATNKIERIILDLNKSGMEYLAHQQYKESLELLKKAEKLISDELKNAPKDQRVNQLAGITFNNIGCYYKKYRNGRLRTNKPKVALNYLRNALELEVYNVEDWISTAGTHLNMCAIYSFLGKHQEAADHASLSVRLLERELQKSTTNEQNPSLTNILTISYYNLGVELEYLRQMSESCNVYKKGVEVAKKYGRNKNILKVLQENVARTEEVIFQHDQRISQAIEKRKEQDEKGFYEYIRKNKKNDPQADYQVLKPIMKRYRDTAVMRPRYNSTNNEMKKGQSEVKLPNKDPIRKTSKIALKQMSKDI